MNEIKSTPGTWKIERDHRGMSIVAIGPIVAEEYVGRAWLEVSEEDALVASAAPDMALALEMIAAEDDAARHNGTPLLTSGVRMTLDAALIKAGRKEAPVPVRHVTIAGVDR
ncbi:hypothetical protein [Burkholderia multivorans]|uniref:hypothetical protein n=1 Tax=Burkholderia multivorans TaxID=87883 RepID=UPI001F36EC04|nr:hypothetical protein [Burkholderia multivorans]